MLCGWITTRICSGRDRTASARLDDLERLVHHGGRVDRDLAPHHPVGMGAGLVGRHLAQRGRIARAERPARGGEHDVVDARGPAAAVFGQALEDRRMLAVDGQQRGAAPRTAFMKKAPPTTSASLLASSRRFPRARGGGRTTARRRRRWPPSPRRHPDVRASSSSAASPASTSVRRPSRLAARAAPRHAPHPAWRRSAAPLQALLRSSSTRLAPVSAKTSKRSGWRRSRPAC